MKISEVSQLTGLTSQNIRFYEKQGLLSPERIVANRYRKYDAEDVKRLKEIKLLRKIGIPVSEIALIQSGVLSLKTAFEKRQAEISQEMQELEHIKQICSQLSRSEQMLYEISADAYLEKIERIEAGGGKFYDILKDFMLKVKNSMPDYRAFVFEPMDPILSKRDFTNELIAYCRKENKDLTILKESMMPLVRIDGEEYMCQLEQPRTIDLPFPWSMFFMVTNTYGFRFVYGYRYQQ